jgi:pyrroline-5-carboxylate reductase
MASALIGGLIKKGVAAKNIFVADPYDQTRMRLESELLVITAQNITKLAAHIESSDVVVMAVKPQQFKEASNELAEVLSTLKTKPLCLSVAAGIRTSDMAAWLGHTRLVRAMPNTPALISQGMTGLYTNTSTSNSDKELAENICQAVGKVVWVNDEKQMDDITAVSGSGPAYVFAFLEALENAGIAQGLQPDQARLLAIQTVQGAASLAAQSSEPPSVLREKVTSKGGTTYAALQVLEKESWADIMAKAIKAASARGAEMGDEFSRQ